MLTALLDQFLRQLIVAGSLEVTFADGRHRTYGDGAGPALSVATTDPDLPRKLILNPPLALGEAYMDGRLTIGGDDLRGLMALLVTAQYATTPVWWRRPVEVLADWVGPLAQINPARRARANVAHHYDLSGELYDLFLDADKQYSCGYFRAPGDTLDQAQAQKKAHIAAKLLLEPGMRVLDVGCGWGGMALTLARDHGVRVLGVTLSEEQHRVATARAAAAGLADRVEFRLIDYRQVEGRFDRIVSVGMFEHVGVPHYRTYFRKVRDLLTDDGVALIHTIGRAEPPGRTGAFVRRYIFPGGYVPAMSEVMRAVETQMLWPTDVEIWRLHYAETLRHWHERFVANIDRVRMLYDDRFCRMWRFYLAGAEMAFRHGRQCVFQFQLARRQGAVPLTRDYLYRPEPVARRPARPEAAE
jgi:cyclopropane-fatty-acyl-phospholipid synthase